MSAIADGIARVRDGDLTAWQGLPAGTEPADLEPVVDAPGDAPAMTGIGRRKALVRFGELVGSDREAEVWVSPESSEVWLVVIADPPVAPGQVVEQLGQPALRLDSALGTVALPGSEWVYPDRGLAVFADEEDERVWRVALFPPCAPEEYEERSRVHLGQRRR